MSSVVFLAVFALLLSPSAGITCNEEGIRRDCGYVGIQESECENNGCCWHPTQDHSPWCFHPNPSPTAYTVKTIQKTTTGLQMSLDMNDTSSGPFGPPITPLTISIDMETSDRLHVKIVDSNNKRWEIPTQFVPSPEAPTVAPASTQYTVSTASVGQPFWFAIVRSSNNETVFNTSGSFNSLIFEDQYLEISTSLPSDANIYGLGEHVCPLRLNKGQTYTLWNFDTATPENLNLYGSHPFYLDLRSSAMAHGVFLRNSNGMDVSVDNDLLTYKVIGGVFDFYFFLGPDPEAVIQQYQEVIGRPHMPPYWALGFHQSRYGFKNVQALQTVVAKYAEDKIPLDTIWNDIDYMDEYKDFTLDPNNYPQSELSQFVDQLHKNGQHYVVIVDPGIKNEKGYKAYDDGVQAGVFIKDKNGQIFIGKVWPGNTAFPDFFNPGSFKYWQDQIASLMKLVSVDGLWIDMNEISNFCNGECTSSDVDNTLKKRRSERIGFIPTDPPYGINNQGGRNPLNTKTLDQDATHYGGVVEYNVHNLFGLTEAMATDYALRNLTGKRSFVLSRSTFPGSGRHTAHWSGDNHATFDDLYYSIPGMLNFQMFGIPLVGSDICGFIGDTNEELCGRWMQLGAFYPFSRNHDDIHSSDQEPYLWPSVSAISRNILGVRYSLLPYYYTLFYYAHRPVAATAPPAATVTRPLFFEFPTDSKTYGIDKQFMVGNGLLISPVLDQGSTSVQAYFPQGRWYDFFTNATVSESGGETMELSTPMDQIQVHVRGGVTIPMQEPEMTTTASRLNPYRLLVALDNGGASNGSIYLDDGISLDMSNSTLVTYVTSTASGRMTLTAQPQGSYVTASSPPLNTVVFLGLSTAPKSVSVNGKDLSSSQMAYSSSTNTLTLTDLNLSMAKPASIVC